MISQKIATPAKQIDEDTEYETILPYTKDVKLPSQYKIPSQPITSTKTAKSIQESPLKSPSVSKTKKDGVANPSVNQITKNLRCIATILLLGLLVLAVAMALVIYFVVVKKGDVKNQETTDAPLPEVELADPIPGGPPQSYSMCKIVNQWMPKFNFLTYGKHAVKAMGYFYTIKYEYFKHRKQISDTKLHDFVIEGVNLLQKMYDLLKTMHERLKDIDFEENVGNLVKCFKKKTANCTTHEQTLMQIMTTFEDDLTEIEKLSIKTEATFRNFSDLVLHVPRLHDMGKILPLYLKGFISYFKSLCKITCELNEKLKTNINSNNDKSREEYACLVIAKQALDRWSSPNEMFWFGLSREAEVLYYWEDKNVAEEFRLILDGLQDEFKKRVEEILKKW